MKKIIFILSCLWISTSLLAQTRIGVYVSGILDENYKTLLANKLVEAFTESSDYIAVNRSATLKPLLEKARSIQQSGHIDYSQIVIPDNTYGESLLCGVNVYQIENMYILEATLLDMETNSVRRTATVDFAKGDLGYTKILEMSQKLCTKLLPNSKQQSNIDINPYESTIDMELARQRVEENRMYDISYATFLLSSEQYGKKCSATDFYLKKASKLKGWGHGLFWGPVIATVVLTGLTFGDNDNLKPGTRTAIIAGSTAAVMIPGIVCWSVAPAYRKKAWQEYRKPYDKAVENLNALNPRKKRQETSLEISPVVGYDWAGGSLKLKFN